jgi:hypothetical protein
MDEIEYLKAYQEAVNAAERMTAPESKRATMLILQLVNALHERLVEIEDSMEDM